MASTGGEQYPERHIPGDWSRAEPKGDPGSWVGIILAFKPTGAVKGMRSGWLLLPAVIFGVAAILQIVRGSGVADRQSLLFSRLAVLAGGVIAYIVLLAATRLILNRQVTTELFLIVGWTVLMFLEVNALFAVTVSVIRS